MLPSKNICWVFVVYYIVSFIYLQDVNVHKIASNFTRFTLLNLKENGWTFNTHINDLYGQNLLQDLKYQNTFVLHKLTNWEMLVFAFEIVLQMWYGRFKSMATIN
jgi:hypothetical protein